MGLVREPAHQGDLAKRLGRIQHEILGAVDPLLEEEAVRRAANAGLEGACEMAGAQPRDRREVLRADPLGKMLVDMSAD